MGDVKKLCHVMVLNNLDDKDNSFEDKIFDLFQIDEVDEDFDSSGIVFHYFFISFIPAIMSGFITNWLEDRYCNDKFKETLVA